MWLCHFKTQTFTQSHIHTHTLIQQPPGATWGSVSCPRMLQHKAARAAQIVAPASSSGTSGGTPRWCSTCHCFQVAHGDAKDLPLVVVSGADATDIVCLCLCLGKLPWSGPAVQWSVRGLIHCVPSLFYLPFSILSSGSVLHSLGTHWLHSPSQQYSLFMETACYT